MKAQTIPPDLYPQMLTPEQATELSQRLRSPASLLQAARILEEAATPLREALLAQVAGLEEAANDPGRICAAAHEIKGLAAMAGLPAAGRIAGGLCHYLEQCELAGRAPDAAVLALHVSAIARTARDAGLDAPMGEKVISELAALAAHKLAAARQAG
jgi:HPt (histidine-containing phosphotransfer) domain-containing protein